MNDYQLEDISDDVHQKSVERSYEKHHGTREKATKSGLKWKLQELVDDKLSK